MAPPTDIGALIRPQSSSAAWTSMGNSNSKEETHIYEMKNNYQ